MERLKSWLSGRQLNKIYKYSPTYCQEDFYENIGVVKPTITNVSNQPQLVVISNPEDDRQDTFVVDSIQNEPVSNQVLEPTLHIVEPQAVQQVVVQNRDEVSNPLVEADLRTIGRLWGDDQEDDIEEDESFTEFWQNLAV
ncbi:unnamed protein product [Lupinus luteus]|uniref:Uncharacterized protein n=1 Tax=Lupinus luteus TaxID=3873 RepID=A0AAV1X163_LUPLU